MKYEEFIAALCQKIREVTKGWNGTSIEFRTTPQNNGRTLDLLVVSKQGKKMNGTYELSSIHRNYMKHLHLTKWI